MYWMFGKITAQTSSGPSLTAGKMYIFPLVSVGRIATQAIQAQNQPRECLNKCLDVY